jgi:hypothetical protein
MSDEQQTTDFDVRDDGVLTFRPGWGVRVRPAQLEVPTYQEFLQLQQLVYTLAGWLAEQSVMAEQLIARIDQEAATNNRQDDALTPLEVAVQEYATAQEMIARRVREVEGSLCQVRDLVSRTNLRAQ